MAVGDGIYKVTTRGGLYPRLAYVNNGVFTELDESLRDFEYVDVFVGGGYLFEKCVVLTEADYAKALEDARMSGYNEGVRDKLRLFPEG